MPFTLTVLAHSENPPIHVLSQICRNHGWQMNVLRPVYGDELPAPASVQGLVILGAAANLSNPTWPEWLKEEVNFVEKCASHNVPIFGVCFGLHILAHLHGAQVRLGEQGREFGFTPLTFTQAATHDAIFGQELVGHDVFQAHGDTFDVPHDATLLASNTAYETQAVKFNDTTYGVQFHPEIDPEIVRRWHTYFEDAGTISDFNVPNRDAHVAMSQEKLPPVNAWLGNMLGRLMAA